MKRNAIKLSAVLLFAAPAIVEAQNITTFAGNGTAGFSGDGGPAALAQIDRVVGLATDAAGNIYLAEENNNRVRKVDVNGIITTFAGTGVPGFSGDGGQATQAQFNKPVGVCLDTAGAVYVNDQFNHRVRKISPGGVITTVAGNGSASDSGDGGAATAASMINPIRCAVDKAGNLFIADQNAARVRKVANGIISTYGGVGVQGFSGDGGVAIGAAMNNPTALATDAAGNLFVADQFNSRIRRIDTNGIIQTVAGNGAAGFSGDGGPATAANLNFPGGVVVDSSGTLYFVDCANDRVRKVSGGTITTIAGTGVTGFSGDGGPATQAQFNNPFAITIDAGGNLYIGDITNNRVRKIGAASAQGAITLVGNAFGDTPLIAPNMWVEIKGTNLSPSGDTRIWGGSDFANNQLPTQLDGVSVKVNGKSAYVYYISPTQVNILTPPDALSGSAPVQLTVGGVASNLANVAAQSQALSFFEFVSSGGLHYVYGRHGSDGSLIGPASLFPGSTTPVKPGESIYIAANGFGLTDVPIVTGALTQSGNLPLPFPVVKVGGVQAQVSFAGLVSVGTFQINFVVPSTVPDGDLPLTATYNGLTIQSNLLITVQH